MTTLPPEPGLIGLLAARGDVLVYRPSETNRCPRCHAAQWLVGRVSAECAVCATALPLVHPSLPQSETERTDP